MGRLAYWVPILTYHRIGEFRGDHVPTVSPQAFERQMRWLKRLGIRVATLDEIIERLERGERVPRRTAAITFDDGYEETHRLAWPVLKRFSFPATVFVTPAEIGMHGFVTWEQVCEMAANGIAIGSHTMHHTYLPLASDEQLTEELAGSKQAIEARLGKPVSYLSYPVGGFTPKAMAIAREAGYRAAYTTNRALAHDRFDRYALRRVKVTERDAHPLVFLAKLSGYYDVFRQLEESA